MYHPLDYHCMVVVHCDNMGACHSIRNGTCSTDIGKASIMAIHSYAIENNIGLCIRYIHTKRNPADSLSRLDKFHKIANLTDVKEHHVSAPPPLSRLQEGLENLASVKSLLESPPEPQQFKRKKKTGPVPLPGCGLKRRK